MNLWCTDCEAFEPFDPVENACKKCGSHHVSRGASPRPCAICEEEAAEPKQDVCWSCADELSVLQQGEFQDFYPELCAECRIRTAPDGSGICDTCYPIVVWGETGTKKDRGTTTYDWWTGDNIWEGYDFETSRGSAPVIIPSVEEEMETIPAMRVAA